MKSEKSWKEIRRGFLNQTVINWSTWVVVFPLIIAAVLGWTVPQIFPAAVEKGLLPKSLDLFQIIKLSSIFSILGLINAMSVSKSKSSPGYNERQDFVIAAITIAIIVVISTWLLSLIWSWVVTDVFAGAVAQGVLPANLTFWQAFLLNTINGLRLCVHYALSKTNDNKK